LVKKITTKKEIMTTGIHLLSGIQFSGGSTILGDDASPNISITPWDITNRGGMGGGVTYVGTPTVFESWTVDIGTTIASAIYFEATDAPTLAIWLGKFASAGFNTNYTYAYNATWGAGSTTINTVARVGVGITGTGTGDPNLMKIIPIDTTVTGWETNSVFSTLALPGTYNFPLALTPYVPDTQMGNDWY
jgi:hypothetical protein